MKSSFSGNSIISINGVTMVNGVIVGGAGSINPPEKENVVKTDFSHLIAGKEINSIEMGGSMDIKLNVHANNSSSMNLTCSDHILENMNFHVQGHTLYLATKRGYSTAKSVELELNLPSIKKILKTGSGDVEGRVVVPELELQSVGSGDTKLRGQVNSLKASMNGSGDLKAKHLVAKNVDVRINGSGDVKVNATQSFNGVISGSGDMEVYGHAPQFNQRVMGSGEISRNFETVVPSKEDVLSNKNDLRNTEEKPKKDLKGFLKSLL